MPLRLLKTSVFCSVFKIKPLFSLLEASLHFVFIEGPVGGGYQAHFQAHFFFEIPLPSAQIQFWKKSQCYIYLLFSLRIRKITASKYDPTKTQKFTRIYKDVLKITGSFQTVIKLSSSEFIAISPCHFTFLPFLHAGNLPSDL